MSLIQKSISNMKRPFFSLALAVCASSMLNAAQLYDITLSNAQKYSQCTILYGGSTMTRFTGKDRSGNVVTKEVKTSTILLKKPVAADVAPAPEQVEEPVAENTTPTETPAAAETTATTEAGSTAPESAEAAAQTTETTTSEPVLDAYATETTERTAKAKDATLRLRDKLAKVDAEFNSLTKPTTRLKSACTSGKSRVERDLGKMDKLALEVADLQEQYNNNIADYTFTKVSPDQRTAYVQNGQAAHKAMLVDMNQRKGSRKIGGLDKYEVMRERYQGIPEYKQAHEWYIKTLNDLEKKWTKMLANEEKKRKSLQAAKKEDMQEKDEEEYQKLAAQLEKNGEDISRVWYNPSTRNLQMLRNCLNKVKDAKRRSEGIKLSDKVGTVPSLIEQFWTSMDEARRLMVSGDFAGAEKAMDDNHAFKTINQLNRQMLPDEFRKPLVEEHRALEQEIRKRSRAHNMLKTQLERKIGELERSTDSADSQLNALLEQIEREKELDAGENTVDLKKKDDGAAATEEKQ